MFIFQDISNLFDSYLEPIPDLEPVSPIVPTTTVQSAPNFTPSSTTTGSETLLSSCNVSTVNQRDYSTNSESQWRVLHITPGHGVVITTPRGSRFKVFITPEGHLDFSLFCT